MYSLSSTAPSGCFAVQLPGPESGALPVSRCQLALLPRAPRRQVADLATHLRNSLPARLGSSVVGRHHVWSIRGRLQHTAAVAIAEPPVLDAPGRLSSKEVDHLVGSRYRLGPLLGRGSFGTVYLANDAHLDDRLVAVKKLSRRATNRLTEEDQCFKVQEEVRLLKEVQSCRFVSQFHALEAKGDYMYLVMEWIDGPSLEDVLRQRGKLTEREAAAAIHDILQTLSHCHGARVCHSDVKPANFLYQEVSSSATDSKPSHEYIMGDSAQGPNQYPPDLCAVDLSTRVLKAIDFGCSQQVSRASPKLTIPKGTPVYSAPELFMRCYSSEADIWSCGMILHQLLTGRLPFWDSPLDDLTRKQVLDGVMHGTLDLDSPDWKGISPEAVDLCRQMLDRREAFRPTANRAVEHPWIQKHMQSRAGSQWESSTVPHWMSERLR